MKQPKEKNVRLFFALWPNEAERKALATWQSPLHESCGGRVMKPDTLHTTLVFLGNVPEHRLEALRLAAQEVSGRGFGLDLTAAHYWSHNHIVYAVPQTVPVQLADLVIDLEHSLRRHRFHFEVRPYKPHVTLLRNGQWNDANLPAMSTVCWRIEDFVLVHSLSDEQGARYEVLARFPLQGDV